ncbi:ribosome biogenesis Kri1 protein [Rutstroemia sp. NJR-2017a BVV2]|nr:ribosome biogenesis Kri1 protein [Rutstroemia sp. NJR-2017a BVV2]
MAKRKADSQGAAAPTNGAKKAKQDAPVKVVKSKNLLDDSDSSEDESVGGAPLESGFKVNEEYAKRFEHNKKREELHRRKFFYLLCLISLLIRILLVEEKYQKQAKPINGQYGDKYDEDSSSSDDEDEDDEGFLATEDLDKQISATLQALRSKDPRVYDEKVTFYAPIEEDGTADSEKPKTEQPMYLKDYHRENLLNGHTGAEEEEDAPRTFAQEQEELKKKIVSEMHAAGADDSDEDEDEGFLVPKKSESSGQGIHPSRASRIEVDVAIADKDPETFLSNFMAARAWVPSGESRFQPFESDDEEEDERAEQFEAAYNLRFEDPTGSNEMLKSYARDVVAAKSVRREEVSGRKKQRDAAREKKEAEKKEREEERARLKRLKIEEMEERLQKIKKAAGIKGKTLKDEEWTSFLDAAWDDDNWEAEMNKRFGEDYYAEKDVASDSDEEVDGKKKKKVKKPKWDDDIDIKDLIPEFDDEEISKPAFSLSDVEEEGDGDNEDDEETTKMSKTNKERQMEKQGKKKAARLERKKIEELVDSKLDLDLSLNSKQPSVFRYRETSPTSFGLTARDILMADDTALNQFAGLKKMAAFRDAEKKRKDKKALGKKARLRQWRKETFGNEDGPEIVIGPDAADGADAMEGVEIPEGKKKKKRSRKNKGKATAEA